MKMENLAGRCVKIGKTSITVKDEDNKTRGVVRDIRTWEALSDRQRLDFHMTIVATGIWKSRIDGIMRQVIFSHGKLYYLNDTRPLDFFHRYIEGHDGPLMESEKKRYDERMEISVKAAEHMTVIDCEIV